MNKKFLVFISAVLFLSLAGCSASKPSSQLPATGGTQFATQQPQAGTAAATSAPTQPPTAAPTQPPTSAPTAQATQPAASTPQVTGSPSGTSSSSAPLITPALAARLSNTCDLLNSHDLAKILVTGELVKEPVQTTPLDHPIFSTAKIPVTEVNCVYYEFHNPGKKDQELLQVTYWLDLPGQGVSSAAWQKLWTEAAKAGQPVSGIGAGAFTSNNDELTFEQDKLYFTLQIVDTSRTKAQNAQIQQQIAQDMLTNLASIQNSGD
jgi:hypothetical protein